MINFDYLEKAKEELRIKYLTNSPFPYLCLDNICDDEKINRLYDAIPKLDTKSRDFVFASNKFEKSNYKVLGEDFLELHNDLHSERMDNFLSFICSEEVFVDPKNHGGGIHQGRENSFLDMHLDFNYHPIKKDWFRNLNLLLYLNKDWRPEYKGHLKLEDLRSGKKEELEVCFNRLIIQQTRAYTLHGYDETNFPKGVYRTSIATYAYTKHKHTVEKRRITDWVPNASKMSLTKKIILKHYKKVFYIKNKLFGSATAKN